MLNLPDLDASKKENAGRLTFDPAKSNTAGWDNLDTYISYEPYALLHVGRGSYWWGAALGIGWYTILAFIGVGHA